MSLSPRLSDGDSATAIEGEEALGCAFDCDCIVWHEDSATDVSITVCVFGHTLNPTVARETPIGE